MTTILLIEDALDLAQVVQRELEAAGYRVRHASDGMTGLQLLTQQPPDLVILDWMLPRMDGLEVLRRMRQSSAVPVLMLTARKEEVDRVIGLEVGADDYVTKPFSMRELIARVHALLRRIEHVQEVLAADKSVADTPIAYGSLRLDPSAYRATLAGDPLDLTRTEFDLLHLLLRNRDARLAARTCWTPSGAKTMSPATARWITPSCACAKNSARSVKRSRRSGVWATGLSRTLPPQTHRGLRRAQRHTKRSSRGVPLCSWSIEINNDPVSLASSSGTGFIRSLAVGSHHRLWLFPPSGTCRAGSVQ